MVKPISNYYLVDFNRSTIPDSKSLTSLLNGINVSKEGELTYSMGTLLRLYEENPTQAPIKYTLQGTKSFNLDSDDYKDCRAFLVKEKLGVRVRYIKSVSSEKRLRYMLEIINDAFEKYISDITNLDYTIKLSYDL